MTTRAATISRTELGLSTLSLMDDTFDIINEPGFDAGRQTWRRELATSPFVAGALEVGAVRDQALGALVMRVKGATHAALQSSISTLVSAFTQSEYTLTVTYDSTSYAWTCQRADYQLGFDQAMRIGFVARVAFTYPRSPVPVSGPI